MLCEQLRAILSGMQPAIKQYHADRWLESYQDIRPPRSAEDLYKMALARREKKPYSDYNDMAKIIEDMGVGLNAD